MGAGGGGGQRDFKHLGKVSWHPEVSTVAERVYDQCLAAFGRYPLCIPILARGSSWSLLGTTYLEYDCWLCVACTVLVTLPYVR